MCTCTTLSKRPLLFLVEVKGHLGSTEVKNHFSCVNPKRPLFVSVLTHLCDEIIGGAHEFHSGRNQLRSIYIERGMHSILIKIPLSITLFQYVSVIC